MRADANNAAMFSGGALGFGRETVGGEKLKGGAVVGEICGGGELALGVGPVGGVAREFVDAGFEIFETEKSFLFGAQVGNCGRNDRLE